MTKDVAELHLTFWPSLTGDFAPGEGYFRSLTDFYRNYEQFVEKLERESPVPIQRWTDHRYEDGQFAHRAMPPVVMDVAVSLGPAGAALAIYKLLKLWVDHRNGRRIRARVGQIEVEATQLSANQFARLLEHLAAYLTSKKPELGSQERFEYDKEFVRALQAKEFTVREPGSDEAFREHEELRSLWRGQDAREDSS